MINIKNYIKENIFDNPEEIAKKDIRVQPKDKYELQEIIINEIKKYKLGETVDLNFIYTNSIIDFRNLFYFNGAEKYNYDISEWDVSNVKYMNSMFYGHKNFNCDLSEWDVSNVEDMSGMFYGCENFNCDLSKWDVSNVRYMTLMFRNCINFEGKGLEKWNTIKVYDMYKMFYNCRSFRADLSNWNVDRTRDMYMMFEWCNSLKKIPNWYKG